MKRNPSLPKALPALALTVMLGACADRAPVRVPDVAAQLRAEVAAQAPAPAASAAVVAEARPPAPPAAPPEPRFDLVVSGANARDVFLSMVGDTRYSMLMHPEVSGTMSVTLRSVTVREALESIRDVYGYDFRIEGRRITVYPPTLQTRIFTVNYLQAKRVGKSEVRVSGSGAPSSTSSSAGNGSGSTSTTATPDSSQISTSSTTDFWVETAEALRMMVGKNGQVVTSPQAGTIAVRAMPDDLRQVEAFLRASRLAIERQVMLEAKIIEVELRDGFQSGIEWNKLRDGQTRDITIGQGSTAISTLVDAVSLPVLGGGALGLTLATKSFSAALTLVESQGEVQVLSSPRVATLNNQKAVLKVGVDEYFVTKVSGGSLATGTGTNNGGTTTLPTLTLTPFFSGIALDVTPQIDEANMITLHLRPSVTTVTEKTKQIDLGAIGSYKLPLASSSVNETDTVVRVQDGNIVAIGGLMQADSTRRNSGLPGAGDNAVSRTLLRNNDNASRKKELVVLIKPTIIRSADDWQRSTEQALAGFDAAPQRTVVVNAPAAAAGPQK